MLAAAPRFFLVPPVAGFLLSATFIVLIKPAPRIEIRQKSGANKNSQEVCE